MAFGGVDQATPIEASDILVVSSNTQTLTAPSVIAASSVTELFTVFDDPTGSTGAWAAPPGMLQRASAGPLAFFDTTLDHAGPTGQRPTSKAAATFCPTAEGLTVVLHPHP